MFEQATLSSGPVSTRLWSTCAGITGQMFLVGTMLLVPLIFPSSLPNLRNAITIAPPGPPPPPPAPPETVTVRPRSMVATRACSMCTPRFIPPRPAMIVDDLPAVGQAVGVIGSVGTAIGHGDGLGVVGSILDSVNKFTPPPPPPPRVVQTQAPAPPAPPQVVRAGGVVQLGAPIQKVEPPYPQLARTARVEGVVELEALVGVDGRVKTLSVKSGHPLLVNAAMAAVRQWIYAPTTLNGKPVEVISPITVTFRLGR